MPNAGTRATGQLPEPGGKSPSFAAASGISAQIIVQPLRAPMPEMMTASGDQVAGPRAATDDRVGRGGVGRLVGVLGQGAGGDDAEDRDHRQQVDGRAGQGAVDRGLGHVALGVADLGRGDRRCLDAEVAEQADRHRAADRRQVGVAAGVPGREVAGLDEEQARRST